MPIVWNRLECSSRSNARVGIADGWVVNHRADLADPFPGDGFGGFAGDAFDSAGDFASGAGDFASSAADAIGDFFS